MPRRLISRAAGFVHDIDWVASLSDVPNNMRLLSDRSLYILQNLSGLDTTFLSRYGQILTGDYYLPAEIGSTEAETVYDAVNLIRKDLNDMTVEDTLTCICNQLQSIASSIAAQQGKVCEGTIGSDIETSDGSEGGPLPDPVDGVPYEAADPITNRKCKAANYIHIAIKDVVNELTMSRADSYGFAGLAFVLSLVTTIVGGLIFGPFGLLLGAVAGSFLAMATMLFRASFSLALLYSSIVADEDGAVCALYEATTASSARANYLAHLIAEGATSLETEFVDYLLTNNLMNLLFFAWGDSETAIADVVTVSDCSTCSGVLEEWYFDSGLEGWTWRDESVGVGSSSMAWDAGDQSLQSTHLLNGGPGNTTAGQYLSPAISHPSDGNQEVSFNLSGPSDSIVMMNRVTIEFDSSPDETKVWSSITGPVFRTYQITTIDTITRITVYVGRSTGAGSGNWNFTNNLDNVILRTL